MAHIRDRDEPIYTISIAAKLVRPLKSRVVSAKSDAIPANTNEKAANTGETAANISESIGSNSANLANNNAGSAKNNAAKPIHAQTLRMYDRLGLVKPTKIGKNRFYSDRDIERLQQIQHFTQDIGINLKGVEYIFAMMDYLQQSDSDFDGLDSLMQAVEHSLRDWDAIKEDDT